jgi:GDP-4-dehydro-6-deoxy-D-mannose reductase
MSKVIITGINGFVGEHVAEVFKQQDFEVIGVGHDSAANEKVTPKLTRYIQCDLLDEDQVNSLDLTDTQAVVHLAGLAAVGQSFEQPRRFMTDNGIMVHNLLQVAARDKMPGRVVVVSSGALYDSNQELPITEQSATNPSSPYAVGKLFAEEITRYYKTRGVDAVIVRPFNHIGPGQGPGFILPDLYDQLMEAKTAGFMSVGNIETKRDYTDVRDVANAYSKLALAPTLQQTVYNICSGKSLSGKEILGLLQKATDTSAVEARVDQSRIRPNDVMDIYGDSSQLREELGWEPAILIEQSVKDFVANRFSN